MPAINASHTCGQSRLKCVDCGAQVCPKCAVECPVGNRCQNCSLPVPRAKRPIGAYDIKKASGFLFFGGTYGWFISHSTFSGLSCCFCVAMWAAGRETGSRWRRGDRELALGWMLPFVAGMLLGVTALFFASGDADYFLLVLINLGMIGLGLLMGRCGFG